MKDLDTKQIKTKNDFAFFIRALRKNYMDDLSSWENRDISSFLEAMAAWVEDMEGFYSNQGQSILIEANWKIMADILMGAKVYE